LVNFVFKPALLRHASFAVHAPSAAGATSNAAAPIP
jgi:hypothetical protein